MTKNNTRFILPILLCILLLISSIIYFNNYQPKIDNYSITLTDIGFDTVISFSSECTQQEFDEFVTIIKDEYTFYNSLFDQYNEYPGINNVCTINKNGYNQPIDVENELIECLHIAFEINQLNSKFDVTQGNLLTLWHNYRTEGLELNKNGLSGNLPTKDEIQEALLHFGTDQILIKGNTIQLLDPDISLDLGGIAKGFATQKVKEKLLEKGCEHGFINAGGNIVLIGQKTNGNPWKIGIQDPNTGSSIVAYNTFDSKSIVTSGDYQRYYTVNDQRYTHIVDPSTGYPANYMRSISIICDNSSYADALSTTLFCMPYEDGYKLVEKLKNEMEIDAIWVFDKNGNGDIETDDFSIYFTPDLKDSLTY